MSDAAPEIVYGAAGVGDFSTEEFRDIFNVLKNHKVKILDTASRYGASEVTLGQHGAAKEFVIHTKAPTLSRGSLSRQSIMDGMEKSLHDLGIEAVELYYFHFPDAATPIEESLSAIQELYAAGKLKRFGVSNYLPQDVQKIHDIQAAAKSVLPTVYQGNYNAVARHAENDLFPLLRKLKMSFYAYSPIAGGLLVKDSAALRSREVEGRFSGKTELGDLYPKMYGKECMYQAVDEWGAIAKDAGISKAGLAYRWVVYHGALRKEKGDGVIIGASKVEQLEETLRAIEAGPLEGWVAKRAGDVWEMVSEEAPGGEQIIEYLSPQP